MRAGRHAGEDRSGGPARVEAFVAVSLDGASHNDLEPYVRRGDGKARIRKGDALAEAEERILPRLAPFAPDEPLEGPLRAELRMCWPTGGEHAQGEPKATKPDCDNVEKVLWDLMERLGFFRDDAQIVDKRVAKMWADPMGFYFEIEEVCE